MLVSLGKLLKQVFQDVLSFQHMTTISQVQNAAFETPVHVHGKLSYLLPSSYLNLTMTFVTCWIAAHRLCQRSNNSAYEHYTVLGDSTSV